ncbi:uncharacterized protein LOC111715931 [Eurytemora carolleeae]|uniref:uncharacterized protein LOC111715931 n=1 Tax=Eurytemora carolleeae TaxID=1294199 RepID=UPI000C776444|nr:uncharacterized protein LOC111715931 [Eurytemora carolleeae]|eukprot:XP_023347109.1 uncharacterized protein LOC111715931 [Eurytemora affinis]
MDLSTAFQNLQAQTDTLSRQFRDLETDVRTNSRDLGNLQESLVKVASDRDMKDIIKRVSTQTSSMLSEFRDTQRNVAKCLSEAEQARKDYIMFKEKTEAILFQLQQSLLMNGVNGLRISSRLSLEKGSANIESNEDKNI